jgi:ADP-heptose:LPS heptosyltransferase
VIDAAPRILVIRLTALGDVVLVEPVIRALREKFPRSPIDLLTEARFAPLGPSFFGVDRVIAWDRHGRDRGLAGMSRVLERLGRERRRAVIDLQNKARTRMLAARISADHHLVLKKRTVFQGVRALFGRDRPIADRHTIDLYLGTLLPLGIEVAGRKDGPRARRLDPLIAKNGARRLIGLSPGATHATKRWPLDRFAELADRIQDAHPEAAFVLIGGPLDRGLLEEVRQKRRRAHVLDADICALDVLGLARAVASLDLLITVDTGPAHLAAAMDVPVVVIFGPTSKVRWGPRGEKHRVVALDLPCTPCSNIGDAECPLPSKSHECMRELGVERVLEAALDVLAKAADG